MAVYEAVQKNKPLIERVVTVTGRAMSHTANLKVRIGTPISSLIEYGGGMPEDTGKIVNGGPMMGRAVANPEAPVTKGTSGILLIRRKGSVRKTPQSCIKCAKCVGVCPMGLEPYLMYGFARRLRYEELEAAHVTDCIECGCCSYTCPAYLPLLDYIRLGKSEVAKILRREKPDRLGDRQKRIAQTRRTKHIFMEKKLIVSPSPHIHGAMTTRRLMKDVVIALIPALIVAMIVYGRAP